MILLHRLSVNREPFHLNPDLIQYVEEVPDCHITLTTGVTLAVAEDVDQVLARVREHRLGLASEALRRSRGRM